MKESPPKRLVFHHGIENIVLWNNFSKDRFHNLRHWSLRVKSVKKTFRGTDIDTHIRIKKVCAWYWGSSFKVTVWFLGQESLLHEGHLQIDEEKVRIFLGRVWIWVSISTSQSLQKSNSLWPKIGPEKNRETNCTGMWSRVFEIQQTLIKTSFSSGREETLEPSLSTCSVYTPHYLLF